LIENLKPGRKINEVYQKGIEYLKHVNPNLIKNNHIPSYFGFGVNPLYDLTHFILDWFRV